MRKVTLKRDGVEHELEEFAMPLLSVGILPKLWDIGEEKDDTPDPSILEEGEEAVRFNAEAHIQQLEEVFNPFHVHLREWCLCSIADNAGVNKKIARLLQVPHVDCLIWGSMLWQLLTQCWQQQLLVSTAPWLTAGANWRTVLCYEIWSRFLLYCTTRHVGHANIRFWSDSIQFNSRPLVKNSGHKRGRSTGISSW